MWPFTRKPVNRRLGQRHVLEVKLRSDVVRAARLRWGGAVLGLLVGTGLAVFILWRAGEWAMFRFLTGNDAFAIRHIEVQTDGDVAREQILRWARVNTGQNLIALDLSRVKQELERVPHLKTATLERVLPHTLRIRVLEREPLAQIQRPRSLGRAPQEPAVLYLDEEGCVMPPLGADQRAAPPGQPAPACPLITGADFSQVVPGQRLDSPPLRAALKLIIAFDRSPMVGWDELQQVDVSAPETLLVRTAQGSTVTFLARDFDRQLCRWRQIYDLGQQTQKSIATLDLAVPNNIPLRWLEANVQPPFAPRVLPPSRPRKKNV